MLQRITFEDRTSWLSGRSGGIGASEAAAVVGASPWQTPLELWKLKLGIIAPKDLSGNAAVEQGNRLEPAIRGMFAAMHPELLVVYHQFDVLFQNDRPWLRATLDGELYRENGEAGILEIKTSTPGGKAGWSEWADGRIPRHYYVQVCHQLLATGFDFAYLFAALFSQSTGDVTLREYELSRKDAEDDMAWLVGQEHRFWEFNVVGRNMPSMPLRL